MVMPLQPNKPSQYLSKKLVFGTDYHVEGNLEDDSKGKGPVGVLAMRPDGRGGFIDNSIGNETRVGTGRVIPTKFPLLSDCDLPHTLFPPGIPKIAIPPTIRFLHRTNPSTFLIYTDGACLNNGSDNPRAGCAFVYKPSASGRPGYLCFPLEEEGPTGQPHKYTSNRAELRAVIAASRFRRWDGEGCQHLVFATDSEYVVEGATNWIQGWMQRGWKTSTGEPVKNKDLWECLLGECERWAGNGVKISFWRIPREWNKEADRWAKHAAAEENGCVEFRDISGILV